jgi:hypothetical protein
VQVKEIAKETNPSVNNKCQATEIRKGNNSMLKSVKNKVLRVFHQNVRGLRNKTNELISSMHSNLPHLLCLTGHHMKQLKLEHLQIETYN